VVVLVGMMTELEGEDTTNTLKVHVAAETLSVGRAVVEGRAAGPVVELDAVDLTDVEPGSVGIIRSDFEKDLAEGVQNLSGIVSVRSGMTSYAAMVARELGIPMISGADVADLEVGRTVTVDGERGVVYEGDVTDAERRRRRSR